MEYTFIYMYLKTTNFPVFVNPQGKTEDRVNKKYYNIVHLIITFISSFQFTQLCLFFQTRPDHGQRPFECGHLQPMT